MVKKLSFLFLLIFVFAYVHSQEESEDLQFSSMAFGVDYMSNQSVNGNVNIYTSQPALTFYSSYYHKCGIDLTFLFSSIYDSDETSTQATQEYNLSLGYNNDLTKWLNVSGLYSHYFYSSNSYALGSSYSDLFNIGIYNSVKSLNADIDVGYYFGESKDLVISLDLSYSFDFENVFTKDHLLSIEPSFSLYTGDINYYLGNKFNDYDFLYELSQNRPNLTVKRLLNLIKNESSLIPPLIKNNRDKIRKLPLNAVISEMFKEEHEFGINSVSFAVPIYYQWGDFMINAGISFYKPMNQPEYIEDDWISFSNVGLAYFINW